MHGIIYEIRELNRKLSSARMESRIYVDAEHFQKQDDFLSLS